MFRMRASLRWVAVSSSMGWILRASAAWADVPPPSDYVEACTIDKICSKGQECVTCRADFNDLTMKRSVCQESLGPLGFQKQCKAWGASLWNEIWCRASSSSADASVTITPLVAGAGKEVPIVQCTDKADADTGCSCHVLRAQTAAPARLWLGWALMGLLALSTRARARSRRSGKAARR